MNMRMKPVLLDCLIVLGAIVVLVALSFLPPGPWLYLPAVLGVVWLTTKALRTFNPLPPDSDPRPSDSRDASLTGGER